MQGRSFVHKGITLLSGIDPVCRACKTADAVLIKDRTLYFCPSPLFGYGISRLLSRIETEAPGSGILCVEADSELYQLTAANIDSAQSKKLHITNISNPGELCSLMREIWGERAFRRVEMIRFTGGWQLYPKCYDAVFAALQKEVASSWSNAFTLAKMGRLYIRNAFKNLALASDFPSIDSFSFGGKPVLVLGAGPSLDGFLDALQECYPQDICGRESRPFKIICVDTCLGALKDRNIIPDLAVILESQHWNLADFTGCRGWDIPFAVDLSALPQSAKQLSGQGYLYMTPWTQLGIFQRLKELLPAQIPPLGSVGLSAVEIARRLTSGPVICAGLDFSFTPDKYHARASPGHRNALNKQSRFHGILNTFIYNSGTISLTSKSGVKVYTNPALRNYRALFEQEFSGDKRIFDITGSGLPLGIKTLARDEALNKIAVSSEEKINVKNIESKNQTLTTDIDTRQIKARITAFLEGEKERLTELRGILSGEKTDIQRLITLLDECDYLYSHFPDSRPGSEDIISGKAISFLNRVRMEIDGMVKIVTRLLS